MCPYLLESQEFQVFLKPQVNLEKELNELLTSYSNKKTNWHIKQLEPFYFIQGSFYDPDMEEAKKLI